MAVYRYNKWRKLNVVTPEARPFAK